MFARSNMRLLTYAVILDINLKKKKLFNLKTIIYYRIL